MTRNSRSVSETGELAAVKNLGDLRVWLTRSGNVSVDRDTETRVRLQDLIEQRPMADLVNFIADVTNGNDTAKSRWMWLVTSLLSYEGAYMIIRATVIEPWAQMCLETERAYRLQDLTKREAEVSEREAEVRRLTALAEADVKQAQAEAAVAYQERNDAFHSRDNVLEQRNSLREALDRAQQEIERVSVYEQKYMTIKGAVKDLLR